MPTTAEQLYAKSDMWQKGCIIVAALSAIIVAVMSLRANKYATQARRMDKRR